LFGLKLSAFSFIDNVSEVEKGQSITAFFTLKGDEEFLLDHFEGFPVMPGVLLLESLKQAACALMVETASNGRHYRLSEVQQVRFGQFARPGNKLELSVRLVAQAGGRADFEGRVHLFEGETRGSRVLQAAFSLVPAQ
jgi:3-hydroxyacyl-[acyl-carrier-protein] dehydratase